MYTLRGGRRGEEGRGREEAAEEEVSGATRGEELEEGIRGGELGD